MPNSPNIKMSGCRKTLPQPWTAAMEATVFTGWIYDHLRPRAISLTFV
jgi:transposase